MYMLIICLTLQFCYTTRHIISLCDPYVTIELTFSCHLKHLDPFQLQKQDALLNSMTAVRSLAFHLMSVVEFLKTANVDSANRVKMHFIESLQVRSLEVPLRGRKKKRNILVLCLALESIVS